MDEASRSKAELKTILACTAFAFVLVVFALFAGGCSAGAKPSSETSTWDGESIDTSWYEAGKSSYELNSAAALAGFAQVVDDGETFEGATVSLMVNVDLADYEWNPIGGELPSVEGVFCGTFDGRNNTISGLYTISPEGYRALFANVSGGTLQNFVVQGTVKGRNNSAGVVCSATNENLINIVSDVDVFSTYYFKNVSTAGLVGLYFADEPGTTFTIKDCVNNGSVTSNNWDVAGLIGSAGLTDGTGLLVENCINNGYIDVDMNSTENDECIAGLVSRFGAYGSYELRNCTNNADVTATDLRSLAGIIGAVQSADTSIVNCKNTGNITTETLNEYAVAAGIVASSKASSYHLEGCTNEGELSTYNGTTIDIAAGSYS